MGVERSENPAAPPPPRSSAASRANEERIDAPAVRPQGGAFPLLGWLALGLALLVGWPTWRSLALTAWLSLAAYAALPWLACAPPALLRAWGRRVGYLGLTLTLTTASGAVVGPPATQLVAVSWFVLFFAALASLAALAACLGTLGELWSWTDRAPRASDARELARACLEALPFATLAGGFVFVLGLAGAFLLSEVGWRTPAHLPWSPLPLQVGVSLGAVVGAGLLLRAITARLQRALPPAD
jgi:hypothetical protein